MDHCPLRVLGSLVIFSLLGLSFGTPQRSLQNTRLELHRNLLQRQRCSVFQPKILGGDAAPCGRFLYMVSLRDEERLHKCGGTLIHESWVLTAAHCVDDGSPNTLGSDPIVYLGAYGSQDDEGTEGVEVFRVVKTVLHPNYSGDLASGFDIALLKLPRPSSIQPCSLASPNRKFAVGKKFTALGWGSPDGSGNVAPVLQQATELMFIPLSQCNNQNAFDGRLGEGHLCAQAMPKEQNTCRGDSGGPLLIVDKPRDQHNPGKVDLDVIVGITSFGRGPCTNTSIPGVYTNVALFHQWIESIIENEEQEKACHCPASLLPSADTDAMAISPSVGSEGTSLLPLPATAAEVPSREDFGQPEAPPLGSAEESANVSELLDAEVSIHRAVDSDEGSPGGRSQCSTTPLACLELMEKVRADDIDIQTVEKKMTEGTPCCETMTDEVGQSLLHIAARKGNATITRALIKAGVTVDFVNERGWQPLHEASRWGHAPVVMVLLAFGADVNAVDRDNNTALHMAVLNSRSAVVLVLIDRGAIVDAQDSNGRTPLHLAAQFGDTDIAKLLMVSGADVNLQDNDGDTPLHLAAQEGHSHMAEALLAGGADPMLEDAYGKRPGQEICTDVLNGECENRLDLQNLLPLEVGRR